jgi:hypothetical protein
MTEADWDRCADPEGMLEFLRGRAGERRLRLFVCACWRRWGEDLARRGRGPRLLETAGDLERLADGRAPLRPLDEWATTLLAHPAWVAAGQTVRALLGRGDETGAPGPIARLLRDLFDPFRPPPIAEPAVRAWHGGAVVRLARSAYEDREMPAGTLDRTRLAVLADMLEEAGCADPRLLGHLRGPGPHVRGCFAVDAILGES